MADFHKIEKKWQKRWEDEKAFQVERDNRKKYYIAIVYPYMSGLLHLGHLFTYTFSEIMLRYKRMQGFNTLAKFGFHCTGTPIVAAANRVKEKEPKQIETLKKMGIPDKEIPKFAKPEYWAEYFPKETLKDAKRLGFSIDKRYSFITTDLNPPYDAFIRWQFNKLKDKGYVKKGKHPVVWCPKCNAPTGDHARAEGEGETPQEYLLFKHKLDDGRFLISATLRQDTVLGITNLFVHPDFEYLEAEVNGERWIFGEGCLSNFKEQDFKVKITGKVKGKELIGKKTEEFGGREVLILPATFLDPKMGTGLVHSVPSDSADDLIALRDLQKDEKLMKKYGLDIKEVKSIKPISVLNTPGYGDIAADAMLKKYNVKSQNERDKLEKIKKELYKLSHYTATLNKKYKTGFSKNLEGKKVEEAKDVIKDDLIKAGYAVPYYELTGKVVCRCLTECIVKVVSNQWFIEYNNPKWKKSAHKCLDAMKIYPELVRKQFDYVIDWLKHWACTREFGLGTKLPWDKKWVIESLSDSTIQMAYGTISKYLQHPEEYGFKTDKLNDEFFDYIYLGKGDIKKVEKSTGIASKTIEIMKRDFEYFYPFDFRNSAKDLVQNHLVFCMFNHTAIFPKKYWPKAFAINGRIMVNNEKMSKSKGNFFTARELYEKHGADAVRLTATNAGEGVDDANYDMVFLETVKNKLNEIHDFIKNNYNKGRTSRLKIDAWFESKINEAIRDTTEAMENVLFKSAVKFSFLDMNRNLKWYLNRTNNKPNKELINRFIETQIILTAPFIPHFCEECWEMTGKKDFVSLAKYSKADLKKINSELDYEEELIRTIMADIRQILKLAKVEKPKKIQLFIPPAWKYDLFKKINLLLEKTQNPGEILKEIMKENKFKKFGKDISRIVPALVKDRSKIPQTITSQKDEISTLNEAIDFINKEFKADIEIISAEKSKEAKAGNAMPGKPAILVE